MLSCYRPRTMKIAKILYILNILTHFEIIGANTTEVGYHASLMIDGATFCTGTLLSNSFVITAAKCVYEAFEIGIALNLDNLLEHSDLSFVTTSFMTYDGSQSHGSVALIKIPSLDATVYDIHLLTIPQYQHVIQDGEELQMSGFDVHGEYAWDSQEVVASATACEPSTMLFCVVGNNGKRNLGSPLIDKNDVLLGIVVDSLDQSTSYATRIAPLNNWIQSKIEN